MIGKAGPIVLDELGCIPIDEGGGRPLFRIIADGYETRSIICTTDIESSGWGGILGDPTWPPRSSTAPSTTDDPIEIQQRNDSSYSRSLAFHYLVE